MHLLAAEFVAGDEVAEQAVGLVLFEPKGVHKLKGVDAIVVGEIFLQKQVGITYTYTTTLVGVGPGKTGMQLDVAQ